MFEANASAGGPGHAARQQTAEYHEVRLEHWSRKHCASRRGVIVMTNRNKRLFLTFNDQGGGLVDLVLTSAR